MKNLSAYLISILILLFISSCGVTRISGYSTYSELPGYYGYNPYTTFYARNLNNYPYYYGNNYGLYTFRNQSVNLRNYNNYYNNTPIIHSIPMQQPTLPSSNNYSPKSIPYKSK